MLFSIITVCYNATDVLRDAMNSVLEQSCIDYEYLVIDGGSTDGTVDIIREFEPKFCGRMRWISEKDSGIYDAMNKGIAMASGEYLNFLNADDCLEPEALAKMSMEIVAKPGYGVYYGISRLVSRKEKVYVIHRDDYQSLPYKNLNHQAMFIAREMFDKYGKYDARYKIAADFRHSVQMKSGGEKFCPVDLFVVSYSIDGLSSVNEEATKQEQLKIMAEFGYVDLEMLKRHECKEKIAQAITIVIMSLMHCCYLPIKALNCLFHKIFH